MASNGTTISARYDYDPYGRRTKLSGGYDADFGYTGHFHEQPSWMTTGLNLAMYRAYDPELGRWLSRDPIGEVKFRRNGLNLYAYVENEPVNTVDPLGQIGEYLDGPNSDAFGKMAIGSAIGSSEFMKHLWDKYIHGAWWTDKFYHCVASCKITRECGEDVAKRFGDTKEDCALKDDPEDAKADQKANETGRSLGKDPNNEGRSCEDLCKSAGYQSR